MGLIIETLEVSAWILKDLLDCNELFVHNPGPKQILA